MSSFVLSAFLAVEGSTYLRVTYCCKPFVRTSYLVAFNVLTCMAIRYNCFLYPRTVLVFMCARMRPFHAEHHELDVSS